MNAHNVKFTVDGGTYKCRERFVVIFDKYEKERGKKWTISVGISFNAYGTKLEYIDGANLFFTNREPSIRNAKYFIKQLKNKMSY